jgi:hypothetical protein
MNLEANLIANLFLFGTADLEGMLKMVSFDPF